MPAYDKKVTPELQARAGDADELLDIIVELHDRNGGEQSVTALREAFSHTAAPVVERISNLGGEVTGEAWINQTVRARVPAQRVYELADLEEVSAPDVPHAIEPD